MSSFRSPCDGVIYKASWVGAVLPALLVVHEMHRLRSCAARQLHSCNAEQGTATQSHENTLFRLVKGETKKRAASMASLVSDHMKQSWRGQIGRASGGSDWSPPASGAIFLADVPFAACGFKLTTVCPAWTSF